ncbi:MAG: hypothetical protein JWR86_1470, partial [Enterovirga sp.]|nr:hypothetical protein [Enterovirga sp.]
MGSGRVSFTIPILAVIAFAATLGWFGYRYLRPDPASMPAPGPAPVTAPAPVAPPVRVDAPSADNPSRPGERPVDPGAAAPAPLTP